MEEIITDTIDNGVIENVQIAPIGEYVGSDAKGNPIPEKIDAESLQKIADGLNSTETEVLADIDHNASKPGVEKDTKAAGWFHKFVVDPLKGLFATLKLTKHGKELLENREYRYISPTFKLDKEGKPLELHTASLTNLPAFQGYIDPILNTESNMETITMDMTIEQLKELIKGVIADLKKEEAVKKVEEEIKTENEVHEDIVENLEEKKDAIESGVVQNSEPENAGEATKKGEEEEKPVENPATTQNACPDKTEEVKNEETPTEEKPVENPATTQNTCFEKKEESDKSEVKNEEAPVEEKKEEEKKEEVIKIEALNSAPTAFKDVSGKDKWINLHGQEFWDYLAKHPEIKG